MINNVSLQLEKRTSMRGNSYWLWNPSMPKMPETLIKTVFYIYPTDQDARECTEFGSSGFFFQVPSAIDGFGYTYAVTNSHVIFGNDIEYPVIRVNTTDGKFDLIKTHISNWRRHPHGDDVAICYIGGLQLKKYKFVAVKRTDLIDNKFIEEHNIGTGDDVVMVGRFRVHAGIKKNIPAHSFGNIAIMNEEPIYNQFTTLKNESFLVEMRSISGFSGSPVFVYIAPASFRFKNGMKDGEELKPEYRQKLLGIQWGHITYQVTAKTEYGEKKKIEMDSAMAGVVPAWKILDLIDDEEMAQMRERTDKEIKKDTESFSLDTGYI